MRSDATGRELMPLYDAARPAPKEDRQDQHVTTAPEPIPVQVWADHGRSGYRLREGWALGWTSRQVEVRYIDDHGREDTTWFWANAVRRVEPATSAQEVSRPAAS